MKILLSGSTGFLGKAIKNVLKRHELITIGRHDCDIIADLSSAPLSLPRFQIVIHAAGKAHMIPKTQKDRDDFFLVNVKGTENLLEALQSNLPESFLFISSVAVYGRVQGTLIGEDEALNATDPYGMSKIQAEKLIMEWCTKNSVRLCILRLPLVMGSNPPGNLKAMINGISKGYYFNIAGGRAHKSLVLVSDVAMIIQKALQIGGIYNLTDGYHPSVADLANLIAKQLNKNKPANIPEWLAKILAKIGDILGERAPINTHKLNKLTSDLTFDDSKARLLLGWRPTPVLVDSSL